MTTLKKQSEQYYEAVGRRKTSVARVRLFPKKQRSYTINDRSLEDYFPTKTLQKQARDPLDVSDTKQEFTVSAIIRGGGVHSQAGALRHGIARALEKYDPELRQGLKKAGFIKRDPRVKERKKFGLKKARKRAQWSKR